MPVAPPPPEVLRAFGAPTPPRPLAGGRGTSWVAGDVVLKPGCGPVQEWLAGVTAGLEPEGVRLAQPLATGDGAWLLDGWSAARRLDGAGPDRPTASTWVDVVEAGRALHRALAHVARPGCLDARADPWALADRAAWGERQHRFRPALAPTALRLQAALAPLGDPQLVHGDLTGNVLFSPHLDPGVIDVSPYWRPPSYAEGVVVADALCWHRAPAQVLDLTGVPVAAVARALLFRMATTDALVTGLGDLLDEARRYARATSALGL